MIGQSVAIIAVILVMSFMFMRAGKRTGAVFALPLLCVPLFHLLGRAVSHATGSGVWLRIGLDCTGLLLGAVLCAILARAIQPKRLRGAYLALCLVFQAALTYAYMQYLLR